MICSIFLWQTLKVIPKYHDRSLGIFATCFHCTLAQARPAEVQLNTESLLAFRTICDMSLAFRARAFACSNGCATNESSILLQTHSALPKPKEAKDSKSIEGWKRWRRHSRRYRAPHYYVLKTTETTTTCTSTTTSTSTDCLCSQNIDPFEVSSSTRGTFSSDENDTTFMLPFGNAFVAGMQSLVSP